MKSLKIGLLSGLGLLLSFGLIPSTSTHPLTLSSKSITAEFAGTILALSDADQLGGAYANGVLNKAEGVEDSLSLISTQSGPPRVISQLHVSNSVVSWPAILACHPTQPYAYVAETRAVYQGEADQVKDVTTDLPEGTKITVVDFSDPIRPVKIQEKAIGKNMQGVSLNQKGSLLVAGSQEPGKEIVVIRLQEGWMTSPFYFTSDALLDLPAEGGIKTIEFHPTDDVIAVNLNNRHLLFLRVEANRDSILLHPLGEPLEVAKHWSVGNWHPSGDHFILSDVAWGDSGLGFVLNGRGRLISVRYDPLGSHQVVSEVKVGRSPEGFDLSPDGQYAVAVNMRRTYLPPRGFWFVSKKEYASLTLVKIDRATGTLTRLGEDYPFAGMLPEDAIFDAQSNSIAVAVYHDRQEDRPTQGWIDFWEVQHDTLVKTEARVRLTRGVHNLLLVE